MSEKIVRFKKNHSKNEDNNRGYERNKNNRNNNKNYVNGNQKCSNQNKMQEITSCRSKPRETKGSKKNIEVTNPDGGKMRRKSRD